ncbi:MAG: T9SS type A sorting domain-containing protein [Bacteroidetes bacterium]|nr:T9SS type A sorting domain-containing protein [Bacteroidota bacterium]
MFANTDGDILKITPDLNSVTSLIADSIRTVSDLEIAGNSKVYLIGDIRTISSSTNNGTTFTKKSLPFNLTSISFVNQNTGYGVFYNVLLKTNNAASSWDTVYKTSDGSFLRNINFLNDNTGFMYKSYYTGEYSTDTLCFTTNGGTNWTSTKISNYIRSFYEYEEYKTFYNLQLFANGTGYFNYSYSLRSQTNDSLYVGYYRTTNFGQTFQLVTLDSLMFPINFINENTGFGRIANYSLYKTTDKGTSWTRTGRIPNYLFENFVRKVLFVNSNTGFVLTSFRTLMIIGKTTDGGATWSDKRFDLENASATDMKFYGEQLGFIYGGETGQIFRTTDGGSTFVVQTTSEITSVFLLSQNYPNPFNPSTRINYELKITNFVTLKVFDLLGKEVASLVNEKQNAGSYVVDFKSAEYNLPSGIYFYTLNAGDFKETRKMVLIK